MSVQTEEWGWSHEANKTVWQRLRILLYNPADRSVLGRTARRWGVVLTYYAVFYSVLALLCATCMGVLLMSLKESRPTRILSDSLIGDNPGISTRPREHLTKSSADELHNFLKPYENVEWFKALNDCKIKDEFGRPDAPCLYVKVNKIFDWVPQYYDVLPEEAPEELKAHVASLPSDERHQLWVSCVAESGNATFSYPWGRGLDKRFYPYQNQPEYLSPLVAVQVKNTGGAKEVRCRVWARNIKYNPSHNNPSGYATVHL